MRDLLAGAPVPPAPTELDRLYAVPYGRHLRVNFVASVDGAASVDGLSEGLGSEADKAVFRTLRGLTDVILVGAGTVRAEGYGQHRPSEQVRAARRERGQAEQATVAVVTGSADLGDLRLLREDGPRPLVLTCGSADPRRRAALADRADVLVVGDDQVDLAAAVDALAHRGLTHLLCEGGPGLFGRLAAANLVDELCLTTAPVLAGPGSGRVVSGPEGWTSRLGLAGLLEADGVLMARWNVLQE